MIAVFEKVDDIHEVGNSTLEDGFEDVIQNAFQKG